jgi:hypothetical protein
MLNTEIRRQRNAIQHLEENERAGSVSTCSTGVPSNGRAGQVGQDDLKKWQNATRSGVTVI